MRNLCHCTVEKYNYNSNTVSYISRLVMAHQIKNGFKGGGN